MARTGKFILHQIYILNKNFEKYFKEYNFHKLYKELLNFCSLDLSAFYFDIRKDVLYCDEEKSSKRQVCINLLGLILDMLLKWFAPILSFTTEEIFQITNKEKNESIHLQSFPNVLSKWKNEKLFAKWNKLKTVRHITNAAIEIKRSNKEIGSSLEADIKVYLEKEYLAVCKDVDLSECFITSKAEANPMIDDDKLFQLNEVDNALKDKKTRRTNIYDPTKNKSKFTITEWKKTGNNPVTWELVDNELDYNTIKKGLAAYAA